LCVTPDMAQVPTRKQWWQWWQQQFGLGPHSWPNPHSREKDVDFFSRVERGVADAAREAERRMAARRISLKCQPMTQTVGGERSEWMADRVAVGDVWLASE